MTSATGGVSDLAGCFADAALQRFLMTPRLEDQHLLKQGWRFCHAVDTNILSLYLEPSVYAAASSRQIIGIGEIFRDDDDARKNSIVAALAEFIWHRLQPEVPLLLLPPVNQEVQRVAQHFIRNWVEAGRAEPARLANIQRRLLTQGHELSQDDLQDLRDAVMLDSAPAAALRRMRLLFARGRLRSVDTVLAVPDFDDAFRAALSPARDIGSMFEFSEIKDAWIQRLSKTGRPKGGPAELDAEAMSRLELCNRKLAKIGDGKRRLIYITGDNSLLESGESYKLDDDIWSSGATSFARCFLRHPRAYLNEPDVLGPADRNGDIREDAVTLAEWLQLLLGKLDDIASLPPPNRGKIELPAKIIKTIHDMAEQDENIDQKIRSEWAEYEAQASLDLPRSYLADLEEIESSAGVSRETFLSKLSLLRETNRIEKAKAWDAVFYVSTSARFVLQVVAPKGLPSREVAPLCFEGRPMLLDFMREAKGWLEREDTFSIDSYMVHRDEVAKEDESGYGDYLAHAYLMALQAQWRTAGILASRARERATANPTCPTGPNGREALYFEAFCRRYDSKSVADLDALPPLLREARKVAEAEMRLVDDQVWPHDPILERYEAEELAFKLSRLLFQWLAAPEVEKPIMLEEMARLIPLLRRLRARVDKHAAQLEVQPSAPVPARVAPVGFRSGVLKQLSVRATRNILAIGLQVPTARDEACEAWNKLEQEAGLPNDSAHNSSRRDTSFFAMVLRICGAAHFADTQQAQRRARRELQTKLGDTALEKNRVFPYDVPRFKEMIRQASEATLLG